MSPLAQSLWVALGAAVGANARFWIGEFFKARWEHPFPWATLTINLLGSFLIGLAVVILAGRPAHWHLFVVVGLLGGFTTFSAFSIENVRLMQEGQAGLSLLYSLGSCGLGISLAWAGFVIGTKVIA